MDFHHLYTVFDLFASNRANTACEVYKHLTHLVGTGLD
jgi:hypothetical protein